MDAEIISIAQQASPLRCGHEERDRAQFTRLFTGVKTMLSSVARPPGDGDVGLAAPRPAWVVTGRRWITSSSKSIGRGLVFSSIAIEFSLLSSQPYARRSRANA